MFYACRYICMQAAMYVCRQTCMGLYGCTSAGIHIYCVNVDTFVYRQSCTYKSMYVCVTRVWCSGNKVFVHAQGASLQMTETTRTELSFKFI